MTNLTDLNRWSSDDFGRRPDVLGDLVDVADAAERFRGHRFRADQLAALDDLDAALASLQQALERRGRG